MNVLSRLCVFERTRRTKWTNGVVFVVQSRTILLNNLTKLFGGESWTSQKKRKKRTCCCVEISCFIWVVSFFLSPLVQWLSQYWKFSTPHQTEKGKSAGLGAVGRLLSASNWINIDSLFAWKIDPTTTTTKKKPAHRQSVQMLLSPVEPTKHSPPSLHINS